MRGDVDDEPAPVDVEVRMMTLALSDEPDPDGERHRRTEVLRLEPAPELLVTTDDLPRSVDVAGECARLIVREMRHPRTTHLTAFTRKVGHLFGGAVRRGGGRLVTTPS